MCVSLVPLYMRLYLSLPSGVTTYGTTADDGTTSDVPILMAPTHTTADDGTDGTTTGGTTTDGISRLMTLVVTTTDTTLLALPGATTDGLIGFLNVACFAQLSQME